ncbi:hypothetical protein DPMN_042292 [Dreissena polymorpha]|uniref:Uncharacterized protein n=1 Tax=Dreissena polymorpha TaxID=45954 RepID=A0A9D4HWU7_DREPO|nr:hypothetical protein DPMN_042292 [Dreissena polymorpha]
MNSSVFFGLRVTQGASPPLGLFGRVRGIFTVPGLMMNIVSIRVFVNSLRSSGINTCCRSICVCVGIR